MKRFIILIICLLFLMEAGVNADWAKVGWHKVDGSAGVDGPFTVNGDLTVSGTSTFNGTCSATSGLILSDNAVLEIGDVGTGAEWSAVSSALKLDLDINNVDWTIDTSGDPNAFFVDETNGTIWIGDNTGGAIYKLNVYGNANNSAYFNSSSVITNATEILVASAKYTGSGEHKITAAKFLSEYEGIANTTFTKIVGGDFRAIIDAKTYAVDFQGNVAAGSFLLERQSTNTQAITFSTPVSILSVAGVTGGSGALTGDIHGIHVSNIAWATDDNTGIWLDKQITGDTLNYGIVLNGDGAGADIVFGDTQQNRLYNDSTNDEMTMASTTGGFVLPGFAVASLPGSCTGGAIARATDSDDCSAGSGNGALCACNNAGNGWVLLLNY